MIRCCNATCNTQWFHLECVSLSKDDVAEDEDWWCSKSCEDSGDYIYCTCQKSTAENDAMVQCHLGPNCTKHEWYHPSCLLSSAAKLPGMKTV